MNEYNGRDGNGYQPLPIKGTAGMSDCNLAAAFNAWMDDYVNRPDSFADTKAAAMQHLSERLDGREPSYGQECAAILNEYLSRYA
jgi:hypothetical protein